jgi:hypothetical protein
MHNLLEDAMRMTRACIGFLTSVLGTAAACLPLAAQQQKPNILVIMGDDIGYWNISAYNRGMMGYRTPNIDRIGRFLLGRAGDGAAAASPVQQLS